MSKQRKHFRRSKLGKRFTAGNTLTLYIPYDYSAGGSDKEIQRVLEQRIDKTPFNSADYEYDFKRGSFANTGLIIVKSTPKKIFALRKQIGGIIR